MLKIVKLSKELSEMRGEITILEEEMKKKKAIRDEMQVNLIKEMNKNSLKSVKTDQHTFSLAKKRTVYIVDEQTIIDSLEGTEKYKDFVRPALDQARYKKYATELMKETGEVILGMDVQETEYMSVRNTNPKA